MLKQFRNNWFGVFLLIIALWALLSLVETAVSGQRLDHVERITVHQQETFDFKGIEFYELRNSKGAVLLSGDKDLGLIQFLRQLNGHTAVLIIEVPDNER